MKQFNKLNLHEFLAGRGLTPLQRDVLMCFADYGNYGLEEIKPSLGTIAKKWGLNVKTIRKTAHELQAIGWLHEVEKATQHVPAVYRILLPDLPRGGTSETPERKSRPTTSRLPDLPPDSLRATTSRLPDLPRRGTQPVVTSSSPVKNNQSDASASSPGSADATPMDDGFKEFFSAFRKQVDKSKAIRLYQNALESGVSASTLLSSAKRYMVSVEGRETKFTKGPATWLEKECWTEFPIPASRPESLAAVETWILSQFGALDLDWDLTPRALDFVRVNFGKMTKEEMLETVTANMADGLELGRAKK